MSVNKTAQGTWRARVKFQSRVVADQTFARKTDAVEWHDAQVRKLRLGDWIDPKSGREPLGSVIDRWLRTRENTVAGKTYQTDEYLLRVHVPQQLRLRPVSSIRPGDIEDLYVAMVAKVARASVVRFKGTLGPLFAWAVRQQLIAKSPVVQAQLPRGTGTEEREEIYPFTLDELRTVFAALRVRGGDWADLAHVLGLSGIRWGELSAVRVRDIQHVPYPAIRVSRSAPDGQKVRTITKGGSARSVPLVDELLPIIAKWSEGKNSDDLLFAYPASGKRIGARNWSRKVGWEAASMGRNIHQLRHTAATLWLRGGIDAKTVQQWLGHSSAKITYDTYMHWMGSDADLSAVSRMNAVLGDDSGTKDRNLRASDGSPGMASDRR